MPGYGKAVINVACFRFSPLRQLVSCSPRQQVPLFPRQLFLLLLRLKDTLYSINDLLRSHHQSITLTKRLLFKK